MSSDKLLCQTLGVTVVLLALAGCLGTRIPTPGTPFRTSTPAPTPSTPTPVPQPTATLVPMSVRGRLLDMQGNPVVGKPVVLCYQREGSMGVILEPLPQDLEAKTGSWSGATDDQGVFVLGASAGQPDIHPSSEVPGNRYTLVMGSTARSGEGQQACSPYVLLGAVYFRESCSGDYRSQTAETLWFALENGGELDLGIMVYLEEENPSCCK